MCVSEDGLPEVNQQFSLGEVLDLIPGNVVDGHPLVPAALQAAVDMEQQVHVIIPTKSKQIRHRLSMPRIAFHCVTCSTNDHFVGTTADMQSTNRY